MSRDYWWLNILRPSVTAYFLNALLNFKNEKALPQKYGAPEKHLASPAQIPTANTFTRISSSPMSGMGRDSMR